MQTVRRAGASHRPRAAREPALASSDGDGRARQQLVRCKHRGGRRCAGVCVPRSVCCHDDSGCRVVRPSRFWQRRSRRRARRTVALVRRSGRPANRHRRDHPAGTRADQSAVGVAAQQSARRRRRCSCGAGCEGYRRAARLLGRARNARRAAGRTPSAPEPSRCAQSPARHLDSSSVARCSSASDTTQPRCGSCCRSPSCSRATPR